MARKGSDAGAAILIGLGAVIWLIAQIPAEVWEFLLGVGVVVFVIWALVKLKKPSTTSTPGPSVTHSNNRPDSSSLRQTAARVTYTGYRPSGYSIPEDPRGPKVATKWIPHNQPITIASFTIPGGMIFVGSTLKTPGGSSEPSQIDARFTIAREPVDLSQRLMNYWPCYSDISPQARRAYLQWLADGRANATADVGYVFLFFYGLERRALVDAQSDPEVRAEIPAIITEIKRLQNIYGTNGSFRHYSSQLVDLLELQHDVGNADESGPPTTSSHREMPLRLRIGLGQMAVKQRPVPAEWALAWSLCDSNVRVPKALTNVSELFKEVFTEKYTDKFGDGMKQAINKTKLRVTYRPASPGLLSMNIAINVGDIPDVTVVTTPVKRLQALVDECQVDLSTYSRYITKHPENTERLESYALLPVRLWPDSALQAFESLKKRVATDFVSTTTKDLVTLFGSPGPVSRNQVVLLQRSLETANIAMEPDVLGGDRIPKESESIVLFSAVPDDRVARSSPAYQAAAVTLDLAASVAAADGDFSRSEISAIGSYIDSWVHLSLAHRARLKARLNRLISGPPLLSSVKKRLEPLSSEARRTIASFLAHLAHADGSIDPAEVKLLERIYGALGIDVQVLYSDLHTGNMSGAENQVSSPKSGRQQTSTTGSVITLDPARIAALQQETEQVSKLLAGVFVEESQSVHPPEPEETESHEPSEPGVLGLDTELSAFLRVLLSRSTWSRADLNDLANDMHVMADGALERINDAAFEHANGPLTEGEDPVEINREILEALPI